MLVTENRRHNIFLMINHKDSNFYF